MKIPLHTPESLTEAIYQNRTTATALARKLGVTPHTVYNWQKGRTPITPMATLAVDAIFTGTEVEGAA